jgi:HEAT repeats
MGLEHIPKYGWRLFFAISCLVAAGCGRHEPAAKSPVLPHSSPANETVASSPAKPVALLPHGYAQATAHEKVTLLRQMAANKDTDCLPALVKLLREEPDPNVQQGIIDLLGATKDPRALPPLALVAESGQSRDLRIAAIQAMGDTNLKEAVPLVSKFLSDPDSEIREAASFEVDWLTAKPMSADFKARLKRAVAGPVARPPSN